MTRRSVLSAVTLTVLVLLLVVGAVAGYRALTAPLPGSGGTTTAAQPCQPRIVKGDMVRSKDVTVSVYNAGTRNGLAGQTLDQLAARGFIKGNVGNAPDRFAGVQFVRVLAPAKDDPVAKLVALQFGSNTPVQPVKRRLGQGVEVIVGNAFVGLKKAPTKLRAATNGSGC